MPNAMRRRCRARVARRELEHLGEALGWTGDQLRVAATRQHEGPGNALLATLEHEQVCEVFTRFGVKGLTAETVAQELARDVRAYLDSDAALGPYLADQWALPLALAVWRRGQPAQYTCTELTAHARSNFGVIGQFLPVRFSAAPLGPAGG